MFRLTRRNRNAGVDLKGEKRTNVTHASTTDSDARLYKKSPCTGAMLCFMGNALMENRSGLIVQGDLMQTDVHAERRAALDIIHRHSPGSTRQLTLGADKGFNAAEFVADLRHVDRLTAWIQSVNPRRPALCNNADQRQCCVRYLEAVHKG